MGTIMMSSYLDNGNYKEAFKLLQSVTKITGECDAILLDSLLKNCLNNSEIELIDSIISNFIKEHQEIFKSKGSLTVFHNMCENLILHYIHIGELDIAKKLLTKLKEHGYINEKLVTRLYNSFTND